MKLKKLLISAALLLGFVGLFGLNTQKVEADSGYVMDGNQRPIVGMWVEVEGGVSGWATIRNGNPNQSYNKVWLYNTRGKRWRVSVGVGGTSQQWQNSILTPDGLTGKGVIYKLTQPITGFWGIKCQ